MGEPLEFCQEIDQIRLEAAKAEVARTTCSGGGGDISMADQRLQVSISALPRRCNSSLKIPVFTSDPKSSYLDNKFCGKGWRVPLRK